MSSGTRTFVHVFSTFGAGGPQIRAVQLLAHLGPSVRHVIQAMDGCTDAKAQLPVGLDVRFAPPPPRGGFHKTVRAQRVFFAKEQPDLVLTYNWGAIESVNAARHERLPRVHHEDGFGPEETQRRLRRRNWMRWWVLSLSGAVPVIVPSQVLQGIALAEWGLGSGNVHHLPNGVDLARFRPASRTPSTEFVVGTVGGLRAEKDQAMLLHAMERLDTGRCVIVGGGALDGELRALASSLDLSARVHFAGPVTDTSASYAAFDVFALSSRTEQMPMVLLEAMACGLPVVATDVGDVRRILPEEGQAFVVPARDPEAFGNALGILRDDAELRRRLGAANRRVVEARYESRLCLDRFAAIYRGAMR
jgi:glycosyltransferase involved in cell wall biosynthesis